MIRMKKIGNMIIAIMIKIEETGVKLRGKEKARPKAKIKNGVKNSTKKIKKEQNSSVNMIEMKSIMNICKIVEN